MKFLFLLIPADLIFSMSHVTAQVPGCTDPLAVNYNQSATVNDGSCYYNISNIEPLASVVLSPVLSETSGLILWNGNIWTHNDNSDINLYCLDTIDGRIIRTVALNGIENKDWEEVSQDKDYIYIGDFGNNSGDRTDLRIFRIAKNSLTEGFRQVDSIKFSYPDQVDFTPAAYKTDFDCEAFIVAGDSIYLFTKQWISNKTNIYSLSKNPGNYVAKLRSAWDVNGLVTGATFLDTKKIAVLSGYSEKLVPFIYLLYDFNGYDFFSGNKRKVEVLLPYHQIEGIATSDGVKFYISNEHFSLEPFINVRQKLHVLDLSPFLGRYLNLPLPHPDEENNFIIYPVPAHDYIAVRSLATLLPVKFALVTLNGGVIKRGILAEEYTTINISRLPSGTYILKIGDQKQHSYKIIKE